MPRHLLSSPRSWLSILSVKSGCASFVGLVFPRLMLPGSLGCVIESFLWLVAREPMLIFGGSFSFRSRTILWTL